MTDFGAILTVRRADEAPLSDAEYELVGARVGELAETCELRSSMGKRYGFDLGRTRNAAGACTAINVVLSDYYGFSSEFELHAEAERDDVAQLADELARMLPGEYEVEGAFEWW
jgi:hypothetical protein